MPNYRLRLTSTAALLSVVALTGCSITTGAEPQSSAKTAAHPVRKILFDYPFTALPVFTVLSEAAKKQAAKQGVEIEFTNDNMDLTQQVTNLTTFVNSDVDAVVSFAVDPTSLEPLVGQYQSAGKYWVSFGGDVRGQDASIKFGFEQSGIQLGRNAGEWIEETLGGSAKVLVLEDQTIQIGKERTAGILKGLAEAAPDAEIVAQQQAVTPDQGLSVTNAVIAQHPDVNIILAASGDAAQGAYQALIASGRARNDPNTYVGGLDGNLSLLQSMKAGSIVRALVAVKSDELAAAIVEVPKSLGQGDSNAVDFDAPTYLVTPDSPDLDYWISTFGG